MKLLFIEKVRNIPLKGLQVTSIFELMFSLVLCVSSGIFQFGWFPVFKETENKSWSNKPDKIVFSFKKGFFSTSVLVH